MWGRGILFAYHYALKTYSAIPTGDNSPQWPKYYSLFQYLKKQQINGTQCRQIQKDSEHLRIQAYKWQMQMNADQCITKKSHRSREWWKKWIICLIEDYNVESENGWRDNFSKKALTLDKLIMTTKESKESQTTELT